LEWRGVEDSRPSTGIASTFDLAGANKPENVAYCNKHESKCNFFRKLASFEKYTCARASRRFVRKGRRTYVARNKTRVFNNWLAFKYTFKSSLLKF